MTVPNDLTAEMFWDDLCNACDAVGVPRNLNLLLKHMQGQRAMQAAADARTIEILQAKNADLLAAFTELAEATTFHDDKPGSKYGDVHHRLVFVGSKPRVSETTMALLRKAMKVGHQD